MARRSTGTSRSWTRPPSRLPGKTVCLSSCSRSASRARSRPSWAARDVSPGRIRAVARYRREANNRLSGDNAMAAPTHNLDELKRRMQGALASLKTELGGLRTGRASASLVDHVQVDAYGTHMPLNQRSMVHAVEKAISAANLGLSPQTEGQVIRLRIPELNQDRRKELAKLAHKYAEAARIAVRHVRRDGLEVLKKLEKDHKISEDQHKRDAEAVQKATDQAISDVDQTLAAKEKEIMTV